MSLEEACVDFLSGQAEQMAGPAFLCLAKLADHLGLSTLLQNTAEFLIQLPWVKNMGRIFSLLKTQMYQQDTDKRNTLLHHPQRGAYTELQVLSLLESLGSTEDDLASALNMGGLQPAEIHTLLGILAFAERESDALLRKAVQCHLTPENLRQTPDWTKPVRIIHNIMLPDTDGRIIHCSSAV